MTRRTTAVEQASTAFASLGLAGAQALSRYVGAVASVAPTTGTFAVGDLVVGQNGSLWVCVTAGTPGGWVNLANSEPHNFSMVGALTVKVGTGRVYLEGSYTVETIRVAVGTAPTGAAVIVDINKNGTTIYTTQGNRPTIAVSTNTATGNTPNVTTFVAGDYLTIDVDQIGSVVAGADLVVTVRLRKTS